MLADELLKDAEGRLAAHISGLLSGAGSFDSRVGFGTDVTAQSRYAVAFGLDRLLRGLFTRRLLN